MIKQKSIKEPKKQNSKSENKFVKMTGNFDNRRKEFLARRPHRSFKRTKRRDYKRSLKLPGYLALTALVAKTIWHNKKVLLAVALIYAMFMILVSSFVSQDVYVSLQEVVGNAREEGSLSAITSTLTLVSGVASAHLAGSSYSASGSTQQIFSVIFGLFAWLATVWLLRNIMAGGRPKVRDGIYSSGGPVMALVVLVLVLLVQMLPAALALIAYSAADSSGLLDQTAILMLFGGAVILLFTLSVYWVTSTVLAMVIVSLPGMYPFTALQLAGDLVVGRRVRVLLRLIWMLALVGLSWLVILTIAVLLDGALKSVIPALAWLPIVPLTALLLSSVTLVMIASYVYIFYRKVVEDDSPPA